MSTTNLQDFQQQVSELLLRHRSLLDVLSKYGQSNTSVNRSVVKSVTDCGCIELHASKQVYPDNHELQTTKDQLSNHLHGELCETCKEVVTSELGRNLFYISALCNQLGISLDDVIASESKKCATLGFFTLT